MSESKARATQEAWRLREALTTVRELLHQGNHAEALTACEDAASGLPVKVDAKELDEQGRLERFLARFNALGQQLGMRASVMVLVPSSDKPDELAVLVAGEKKACGMLHELLELRNTVQKVEPQEKKPSILIAGTLPRGLRRL